MSPNKKKLVSRLGGHLKHNTGDFAINKSRIRSVHQFPVCETTLIINHGFKCILKILAKMFHKSKTLADYQGELNQDRIIQWQKPSWEREQGKKKSLSQSLNADIFVHVAF